MTKLKPKLKNWRMELSPARGEPSSRVCTLTLNQPRRSHNVLSAEVIAELDDALTALTTPSPPAAVIIRSGKVGGFIAGADVGEFQTLQSEHQAAEMLARANQIFHRLENLPMPTVAVINGHCLGGGLELALACDFRIVCDDPRVRLGLPEVQLGIHPGFGGSVRLIETIGALAALPLMLSGRTVAPTVARRLGIVDYAVPLRQLERTAHYVLAHPPRRSVKFLPAFIQKLLPSGFDIRRIFTTLPARTVIAPLMHKKLAAKVNATHYLAPFQLLDVWRRYGGDRDAMFAAEQKSVAALMLTSTAQNLVRVFFLRQALTKKYKKPARKKHSDADGNVEHAHIIGAGVMGGDIAAWCALRGMTVTLHDQSVSALANANHRAHKLFTRKLRDARRVQRAMDRFAIDTAGDGARRADIIIEAVSENLEVKCAVFEQVQKIARADALLATNTSGIPLEDLAAAFTANNAARLVGVHFFNPVANMQLVEIVKGEHTRANTVNQAAAFVGRIGKLPVTVKSRPGFLVNRILMPYLLEAVALVREGTPAATVDHAAREFGMAMGPLTVADTVGLDICLSVAQQLTAQYGGEVPTLLQEKVDDGKLGKKTGEGFYRWADGKPQRNLKHVVGNARVDVSIRDRLIFRYLNETVACLHEKIVEHGDEIDAALIFGTGFAPLYGGPVNYIAAQGRDNLLRKFGTLHEQYGERFLPADGWETLKLDGR